MRNLLVLLIIMGTTNAVKTTDEACQKIISWFVDNKALAVKAFDEEALDLERQIKQLRENLQKAMPEYERQIGKYQTKMGQYAKEVGDQVADQVAMMNAMMKKEFADQVGGLQEW